MAAPKLKLDRSRYHATVHGEGATHAFEQDGLPFSHQGDLVEHLVTDPEKRKLVEKKLRRLAKMASGVKDDPEVKPEEVDEEDDDSEAGSDINFEAWLKDQVKYPQHEIFKEAKKRFSKVFSNYQQLAEFLVFEEQVCSPDEVPTKLGPKAA